MYKKLLIIASLFIVTGCSTLSEIYTDYPKQVATLQASLAAAEHTALIYVAPPEPPAFGTTSPVLRRDPAIIAKIGVYDMAAFEAIEAAKATESQTKLQAAQTAIDALTAITKILSTN
jgi:hypothetical protein